MVTGQRVRRLTPLGQFRAARKDYLIILGLGIFRESLIGLLILFIDSVTALCGVPIPHVWVIAIVPLLFRLLWGLGAGLDLWLKHRRICRMLTPPKAN